MTAIRQFRIEPTDLDGEGCPCCDGDRARGYVYGILEDGSEVPLAMYAGQWTGLGQYVMARLGIVLGEWTPQSTAQDRIFLRWNVRPASASRDGLLILQPQDAGLEPFHELESLGQPVSQAAHDEVDVDTANFYREIIMSVAAQDPRLRALTLRGQKLSGTIGPAD